MITIYNKKNKNNILLIRLLIVFIIFCSTILNAQVEKKFVRQGNREYNKNKFPESEVSYRRAIGDNRRSPEAVFNIGDALYRQNKYDEAAKQFSENISMNEESDRKATGFYNLGNSLLKSKKLKESIEAYKSSLKLKPDNFEAKYNLAYAQDLLKQQEQQQQQQKQKDQENQDKKDQNKNQKKENNDQKNQDQKQDQKQNQQQKQQQQQQQEQSISKDDAQRLLNSLANDEKNVQEKVKLAKAARERKLTVKNW